MLKHLAVALGAGLASALLFVVSARGTTAASLMAYFTALPLIISTLSFGPRSGAASALAGCAAVTVALGPMLGVFFALSFALPGWWLPKLCLLGQPDGSAADHSLVPARQALIWYPVGRVVTWAAGLASTAVLLVGLAAVIRFGGFGAASHALETRIGTALETATSPDGPTVAALVVRLLPVAMAASLFLMAVVNLWVGARVAAFSQRLVRPWPNVPDGLRLPSVAAWALIVTAGPALSASPVGIAAGVVASALALAFALQGLATAHVLTRGFAARRAILALVYFVTFVIPLAIIALTLIGLVDCLFSFRDRRPPTIKPLHPTGG